MLAPTFYAIFLSLSLKTYFIKAKIKLKKDMANLGIVGSNLAFIMNSLSISLFRLNQKVATSNTI